VVFGMWDTGGSTVVPRHSPVPGSLEFEIRFDEGSLWQVDTITKEIDCLLAGSAGYVDFSDSARKSTLHRQGQAILALSFLF
jgi:hypothetical protein